MSYLALETDKRKCSVCQQYVSELRYKGCSKRYWAVHWFDWEQEEPCPNSGKQTHSYILRKVKAFFAASL